MASNMATCTMAMVRVATNGCCLAVMAQFNARSFHSVIESAPAQAGSAQATSVTRIAASSGSLKRDRVHSFTRSRACRYSGRLWRDRSILDGILDGILDAPGIAIDLGLGDLRARVLSEALAAGGRKQRENHA